MMTQWANAIHSQFPLQSCGAAWSNRSRMYLYITLCEYIHSPPPNLMGRRKSDTHHFTPFGTPIFRMYRLSVPSTSSILFKDSNKGSICPISSFLAHLMNLKTWSLDLAASIRSAWTRADEEWKLTASAGIYLDHQR